MKNKELLELVKNNIREQIELLEEQFNPHKHKVDARLVYKMAGLSMALKSLTPIETMLN